MTRHNLCPNPSAKVNATGYSGTASATRVTGLTGFPRTTGMVAAGTGFIQAPTAACAPGDQIVVSFWTSSTSTLGTKTIYAAFTRSAGGDDFSQTFTVTADAVVRRAVFAATAPANATGIYLLFDGITTGTNMAAVMYEPGAVDGGYADGDTAGWVWDGTSGNSASSESTGSDIAVSGTFSSSGSLTGTTTTRRLKTGTLGSAGSLSGTVASTRAVAITFSSSGRLSGTVSGGDAPAAVPGSWETLRGIVAEARADHARNQKRIANPIDCPVHQWPLERGPNGVLHCRFGGHTVTRGG